MSDLSQTTEHQPVPGSHFDDLNMNLVREQIDTAIKRRSYDGQAQPEDYLLEHGCVVRDKEGQLIPTLAGIVLFAREPHHRVSVCGIDVANLGENCRLIVLSISQKSAMLRSIATNFA